MHGSSEGADPADRPLIPPRRAEGVMAALRQGLRLGLVAGSDTHTGRPGGSLDQPRPYWGGLCGVWAERLTRRSIFEAFRARRTYALTGARIALRFSVNGAPMGSEIAPSSPRLLAAEAWAPGPIARVQLMRNAQLLHEECPNADVCRVEFRDLDVEPAFYHCRIVQDDGQMAVCTPVWAG